MHKDKKSIRVNQCYPWLKNCRQAVSRLFIRVLLCVLVATPFAAGKKKAASLGDSSYKLTVYNYQRLLLLPE